MAIVSNGVNSGQVAMTGSAVLIAPANSNRRRVTLVMGGATPADTFLGPAGVTTGNGVLLAGVKGQSIFLETMAAIYGNGPAGATVSYIEEVS
jgi:hypothetical protein